MVYFGLRGRSLSIVMSIIAATAFALQGYDQAVANGLLTLPTFLSTFPQTKNPNIQGTTVAIYEVGCAIGALSCAFLGDLLGRRWMIFTAGCTALVGIVLQCTPFSLAQLIVARVITGLGVGGFTATVPMYISEGVNAEKRGRRVLTQGFFAIGGIVLASWIEFGLFFVPDNSVNWRFPIAFQGFFGLIVTSLILCMPESPRWLVKRDRYEEARSILSALEDMPEDSEVVTEEMELIRESFIEEQRLSSSIFSMGPERPFHRAVLAVGIAILAQMSGINIVTFYSTTIFQKQLHYSGIDARIFSGCLQIWQFIAAGLAVVLIDRLGRRTLLLAGAGGMVVAQAGLAGLTADLSNAHAGQAAIFFYFVAMLVFPIGLFLIPFMYAAEIAPLSVRAKVTATSACANWLFNFLVAEVTPTAISNIGWRYYIVYAAINFFSFCVIYVFFPETKGRTLEEIDDIFIQSKNIFDPVRVEKKLPKGAVATAARIREAHDLEKHRAVHAEYVNAPVPST